MAIAKHLLIQNATAYSITDMDADRNREHGEPIELQAVRCVPVKQNAFTALGVQKNDRMTLFFDCTNSRPASFVPEKEQRIDYDGETYTVRQVTPCYGRGTAVHHYEAALV